jgi:UDP-glucose 4-epimerase
VQGTILDGPALEAAIRHHDVEGVVHLAGFKYAGCR